MRQDAPMSEGLFPDTEATLKTLQKFNAKYPLRARCFFVQSQHMPMARLADFASKIL